MRELIDIVVTESTGLANRKPGDRWRNDRGDEIVFQDLQFYPQQGSYPDVAARDQAFDQVSRQIGHSAQTMSWVSPPRANDLAFALAHFVDANNPQRNYYIAKAFREISPIRTQNNFPNMLPGGFRLQTKAAKKEASGYKPTEVLTKLQGLTPNDIYQQVENHFGADSDEARAMTLFMQAKTFPLAIPRGNMDATAFSNYFCEMLQPMALVMGKPVKGNAAEAERLFLGNQGFSTCTIGFGSGQNTGLSDSILTNPAGQEIVLSSKAGSGAWAAASNLKSKVDEIRNTPAGQTLLQHDSQEVAILDTIVKGGYIKGPLDLAEQFQIITPDQSQQIMALRKVTDAQQVSQILDQDLMARYNDKLRSFKDIEAASQRMVPFFHMLTVIAHQVAEHVNTQTNFRKAASEILNQGALIQMYTITRVTGDEIIIQEFNTLYPSTAVTDVLLRAGKTYYSTGNKGNFTFEILKNKAKSSTQTLSEQTEPLLQSALGRRWRTPYRTQK